MFGYESNFFLVPDVGIAGVILTNADSGWSVARAVMRRTLEVINDEFNAPASSGAYTHLILHDSPHAYEYVSVGGGPGTGR